jgi:3'-phosphoadenosine 5'-phosphosulfate sulfotransferase (PAPS reductase)/FAD synthetase
MRVAGDEPTIDQLTQAADRRLAGLEAGDVPDLASYDWIVAASSAGKDSQAMLDVLVPLVRAAGCLDRMVIVHFDLGRVEWAGTAELAEEQAKHYGVRFVKMSRPQGDLLDHVEKLRQWPTASMRFCTSDHKRGQVYRLFTQLALETRSKRGSDRQVRILNPMGIRAAESPGRSKQIPFKTDAKATNSKRHVDVWYPIFRWSTEDVWKRIRSSGVPHHRAYDLGMPRLSCCFCILAPESALLLAGKHNRALLDEYVAVEERIGHKFKKHLTIATIRDRVVAGEAPSGAVSSWCM